MIIEKDFLLLQELKSTLLGFWPNRKNNNFPAPFPIYIERKHLEIVKKEEYVIFKDIVGTRYLMISFRRKVYLVDIYMNFYNINCDINNSIYGSFEDGCGFLLDGYLLNKTFYIYDSICMFSRDVSTENFYDRYSSIDFVINLCMFSEFKLVKSKYITYIPTDAEDVLFVPTELGVGTHIQYTLFKYKKKHIFNFLVHENENEYILYVTKREELIKFASVVKNPDFDVTKIDNFTNECIVECVLCEHYKPIKVSENRFPDSISLIEKTLQSIKENIKLEEIILKK